MSRRRWPLLLAAVALLVLLVVQMPASLLVLGTQRQWPALKITAVDGTFWQGRAYGLSCRWRGQVLALSTLQWRWRPGSLLTLRPALDIDARRGEQFYRGRLALSPGRLQLQQVAAQLPLALWAEPRGLPLSGRVSIDLQRLDLDGDRIVQASGRVVVEQAVLMERHRQLPLGAFAAELGQRDGALRARLFDLAGPGQLAGELSLDLAGRYRWEAALVLREGADPALVNWLPLLGERRQDGGFMLRGQGALW